MALHDLGPRLLSCCPRLGNTHAGPRAELDPGGLTIFQSPPIGPAGGSLARADTQARLAIIPKFELPRGAILGPQDQGLNAVFCK